MDSKPRRLYEFGPFRLDVAERRLWRGPELVPLNEKAFQVLVALAERWGRLVHKDELMAIAWPDANVEEQQLASNVSILRKALGDDPKAQRYIQTVAGRGYRFEPAGDGGAEVVAVERVRKKVVVEEDDSDPAPQKIESLAVLPFKRLGAVRDEDEYLGQGLADALITRLSNVRQVAVRPTSAVLKYDVGHGTAAQPDLKHVAREQRVDAVLDGSFQRAGDRLRVTVQLVRASDGSALWAEKFDEPFTDLFAVQDAISARVAEALKVRLSAEEASRLARRPTENAEAHRLYLLGRFFWNKMTAGGLQEAIRHYRRAIELDPSYALAHAGVADAYNMLGIWSLLPHDEVFPGARTAALHALAIDDTLAEAHAALAYAMFRHDWDWQGAEREFRRAIELNPNHQAARQFYAEYLNAAGRFDEASGELARALELEPLSLYVRMQKAVGLYFMRRNVEAVEQLRELLQMDAGYAIAYDLLWACYREMGMHAESLAARLESLRLNGVREGVLESLRAAYDASGPGGFRRAEIELWEALPASLPSTAVFIAMNYAQLGERDAAFGWLERARAARHGWLTELAADPVWEPLRGHPRFNELLRRVNSAAALPGRRHGA